MLVFALAAETALATFVVWGLAHRDKLLAFEARIRAKTKKADR